MLITIKFGGTSVGDADRIRSAAELVARVKNDGHRVVVVTSAMSGVTNKLVALVDQAAGPTAPFGSRVAEYLRFTKTLEQDHVETARRAIRDPQLVENVAQALYTERHSLERVLIGSHLLAELTPIGYDFVVSEGERLCVPILANCLRDLGVSAVGVGGDSHDAVGRPISGGILGDSDAHILQISFNFMAGLEYACIGCALLPGISLEFDE